MSEQNLLEITVKANRQLIIESPQGWVQNGVLTDVIQVLQNMVKASHIAIPAPQKEEEGETND